jgi:GNAT superfamily N-acetyltransferase
MTGMHLIADQQAATLLEPAELQMLTAWLGVWPAAGVFRVVPSARRLVAGWHGRPQPLVGVATSGDLAHAVVLSVPPQRFSAVGQLVNELASRRALADRGELGARLPEALGLPHRRYTEAVLRWTTTPAALPYVGLWRPSDHPGLPAWLRPFGPTVLATFDRHGRFLAGAGIKRHNDLAHEIAVGTAEGARGRGLARSLVAQAAQRVLADGAIPLYLHDGTNTASAHVADAAGFADRGWRWLGLADA